MTTKKHKKGTQVSWEWGKGSAEGRIKDIYTEKVTRTIKGTEVTRSADEDNPAYLVRLDDGDTALKSHSELRKK